MAIGLNDVYGSFASSGIWNFEGLFSNVSACIFEMLRKSFYQQCESVGIFLNDRNSLDLIGVKISTVVRAK